MTEERTMDVQKTQQTATTLVACGSACLIAALAMLQRQPVLGYVFIGLCVLLNLSGTYLFGKVLREQRDQTGRGE
ncbi:hypothetical protein [Luteococcus peritonei]|uniref:Uncharacterized protein n=1 Tax=Luteococcus peritonei TaxID=88874 RepID=A0ABW4RVH4_9ACTN